MNYCSQIYYHISFRYLEVSLGQKIENCWETLPEQVMNYLHNYTGKPKAEICKVLVSHPRRNQLNLDNIAKVIELLIKNNFSNLQIFNGIQLVLFPHQLIVSKVEHLIQQLSTSKKKTDLLILKTVLAQVEDSLDSEEKEIESSHGFKLTPSKAL